MKRVLTLRVLPVIAALGASAVALVMAGRAAPAAGGATRLPDLVQQLPRDLVITRAGARPQAPYVLGFRSAVSNVGDGPLVIEGHRSGGQTAPMVADPSVDRHGAPKANVPAARPPRYFVSPPHPPPPPPRFH